MDNKTKTLVEFISRVYKPLRFDMLHMTVAGYRFRVSDSQSGEYVVLELGYRAIQEDEKLLEELIPPLEAFHKKHHSKLARLLRGE